MQTYTTTQGQTWDQISKAVYGSELHIGELMESNPKLLDIFVFSAGTVLNVPEIKKDTTTQPPWRRE